MAMEHKSLNQMELNLEVKVLDESQGIVDAIVSVTNVKDHVNDMVMPGAYKETLEARKPKVCWGHDWKTPVGKTLSIEELMPGDPRLPLKLLQMGAGALQAKVQFNMKTTRGRDAFEDVKFWQEEGEWSIGYDAKGQGGKAIRNASTGVREIHKMALFEVSPVLFGAAPHTSTLAVKSYLTQSTEFKVALHRPEVKTELDDALDPDFDGMDPEDILELSDDEAADILKEMIADGLIEKSLVDYFELKDYDPQVTILELAGKRLKGDGDNDGIPNEGHHGNGRRGVRAPRVARQGSLFSEEDRKISEVGRHEAALDPESRRKFDADRPHMSQDERDWHWGQWVDYRLNEVHGQRAGYEGSKPVGYSAWEGTSVPNAAGGTISKVDAAERMYGTGSPQHTRAIAMAKAANENEARARIGQGSKPRPAGRGVPVITKVPKGGLPPAPKGGDIVTDPDFVRRVNAALDAFTKKNPKMVHNPALEAINPYTGKSFEESLADYMELKDVYSAQIPPGANTGNDGMVTRPGVPSHKCKGKGCKVCAKAKMKGGWKGKKSLEGKGSQEGAERAAASRRDGSRFIGTSKLGDIRVAANEPLTVQVDIKSLDQKLFGIGGKKPRDGDGDGVADEGHHGNGRRGVAHPKVRSVRTPKMGGVGSAVPGPEWSGWDRWAGDNSARQHQVSKMRKKMAKNDDKLKKASARREALTIMNAGHARTQAAIAAKPKGKPKEIPLKGSGMFPPATRHADRTDAAGSWHSLRHTKA